MAKLPTRPLPRSGTFGREQMGKNSAELKQNEPRPSGSALMVAAHVNGLCTATGRGDADPGDRRPRREREVSMASARPHVIATRIDIPVFQDDQHGTFQSPLHGHTSLRPRSRSTRSSDPRRFNGLCTATRHCNVMRECHTVTRTMKFQWPLHGHTVLRPYEATSTVSDVCFSHFNGLCTATRHFDQGSVEGN